MKEKRVFGARDVALEVLMQVDGANAWSDGSLKRTIAKHKLDSRACVAACSLNYLISHFSDFCDGSLNVLRHKILYRIKKEMK